MIDAVGVIQWGLVFQPRLRASEDRGTEVRTPVAQPFDIAARGIWTRSQRIRTAGQLSFEVAIKDTVSPPVYQRIAVEARALARLGLCDTKIAKALGVTDKTVAKAIAWITDPLEPGSGKRSP